MSDYHELSVRFPQSRILVLPVQVCCACCYFWSVVMA
jgi:hypothetical protein